MNLRIAFLLFSLALFNLSASFAGSRISTPPPATSQAQATEEAAAEMQSLDALESWVINHPETTAAEVALERPELLKGLNLKETSPVQLLASPEDPMGIPSFLWGCVLGPVGIIMAYIFSDKNQIEAKKALNGCVFRYVLYLAIYAGMAIYSGTL